MHGLPHPSPSPAAALPRRHSSLQVQVEVCQLEETFAGSVTLSAQQQRPLSSRRLAKGWAGQKKGTPGGQVCVWGGGGAC